MKKKEHIEEAEKIGGDSWDLINYNQLPNNAATQVQVAALKEDQRWQEDHHNQTAGQIDQLIQDIENEKAVGGY